MDLRKKLRKEIGRDHKIDFEDVRSIFEDYTFIRRSDRHGEVRYQIFGYVHGQEYRVPLRPPRRALLDHLGAAPRTRIRMTQIFQWFRWDDPRRGEN